MNTLLIVLLVLIIITFFIVGFYISSYNKLQKHIIRIQEAEYQIDDTLRKRIDLLTQIETYINNNTGLKQDNFKNLKSDMMSNFDIDRKLTKITDTFNKIRLDYPDDLDTQVFRDLMTDLKINEEKNTAAKSYYNKFTTKANELIKKFPSNMIARVHNIETRNYFDNKNLNDKDILDFKI